MFTLGGKVEVGRFWIYFEIRVDRLGVRYERKRKLKIILKILGMSIIRIKMLLLR